MRFFKSSLFLSAVLGVVSAFSTFCAGQDAPQSSAFNVMSFNVRLATQADGDNYWENRKETLLEVVKESDPLLLGVQEALLPQKKYLDENLKGYRSIGVGREDGKETGEIMAIFYKEDALELLDSGTFWLSETPEKPSKGWDAACFRTATWGKFKCKKTGKEFVYCNTHLDHVGTAAREKGAQLLLKKGWELTNHGEFPYFVTGDFNVTEKAEAYRAITQGVDDVPGLFDTNKIAKEHEIAQNYTFHNWGKVKPENGSIIDFIFVNDRVKVEKFKINPVKHSNGRFASDHVSIVATLSFK